METATGGKTATKEAGQPESTSPAEATQDKSKLLGEIKLSSPKARYRRNEPIPLELTFTVGKFDLLLARRYVDGDGAFVNLSVTEASGTTPPRKQIITISDATTRLYYQGNTIYGMAALELASGKKHQAKLNDLRELFDLPPGTYHIQVKMHLPVFRGPKIPKRSPAIMQIEEEIVLIKQDRKLTADAKADAITALQQQIQELEAAAPPKEPEYFVDAKAIRGYVDLESNVLEITIE